jgi:hypothetical protein
MDADAHHRLSPGSLLARSCRDAKPRAFDYREQASLDPGRMQSGCSTITDSGARKWSVLFEGGKCSRNLVHAIFPHTLPMPEVGATSISRDPPDFQRV